MRKIKTNNNIGISQGVPSPDYKLKIQTETNPYTIEDIQKAKKFLSGQGYGTGSNFSLTTVATLMAEWAAISSDNLLTHSKRLELLAAYNLFLLDFGYTDSDIVDEAPYPIDTFMAHIEHYKLKPKK